MASVKFQNESTIDISLPLAAPHSSPLPPSFSTGLYYIEARVFIEKLFIFANKHSLSAIFVV